MFSLNVGQGTVVSGTFSGINWATNAKFMQMEMDPAGGSSYIDMGTSQMMSVPYAKYAERSGNGFTHYVGEIWGGGIVYHVYRGADGQEHGLILSLTDLYLESDYGWGYTMIWSNVFEEIGTSAQSSWNGLSNSNAIISQEGHIMSAAKMCLDLVSGGYDDWYLPSKDELFIMYGNRFDVNRSLAFIDGSMELTSSTYGNYWTSNEGGASFAIYLTPEGTFCPCDNKMGDKRVRAIRSF
jgi:hypothetical protein